MPSLVERFHIGKGTRAFSQFFIIWKTIGCGATESGGGSSEHLMVDDIPGLAHVFVGAVGMAIRYHLHHFGIGGAIIPGFIEDVFKRKLLHIEALKRRADAFQIGDAFFQGGFEALARLLHITLHHAIAAKVAQVAPNVGLIEKFIAKAPHLHALAKVVEHRHLALRYGREHCFGYFGRPFIALIVEKPAHLQPLGFFVDRFERTIHMFGEAGNIFAVVTGRFHFVEKVDAVDVVGAKQAGLFFKEQALNFGIERVFRIEEISLIGRFKFIPRIQFFDIGIRVKRGEHSWHMPGKSRQHRAHIECALASKDFLLEHHLPVEPLFGQGTAPSINIRHAMPRQIHRAGEITAHLLIGHSQSRPHIIPHTLLPRDGQRHIHPIERHPVDYAFPILPVEERHRVAKGAIIEKKALRHTGFHRFFLHHLRKHLRQIHRHIGIPRHGGVAIFLQVAVQTHRHRIGIVGDDAHLIALIFQREIVHALGFSLLKFHFFSQASRQSASKCIGFFHLRIGG